MNNQNQPVSESIKALALLLLFAGLAAGLVIGYMSESFMLGAYVAIPTIVMCALIWLWGQSVRVTEDIRAYLRVQYEETHPEKEDEKKLSS